MAKDRPDHVYALDVPTDAEGNVTLGAAFTYCWTDNIGLEWAIEKGHLGICGIDSSWKKKSKSNAPLTAFAAFDTVTRRGLPIALTFSASINQASIERFLRWLVDAVQRFATRLLTKDISEWPANLRTFADRVRDCAAGNWRPSIVTLDKSRAEFNALRAVWPELLLRLCFWHIANAILKWQGEKGEIAAEEDDLGEARARDSIVPKALRKALIPALVAVFRAPTASECHQLELELYETGITELVDAHAGDRAESAKVQLAGAIKRYVSRNWLDSEIWVPTLVSYCLPAGVDLDSVNTNNCRSARAPPIQIPPNFSQNDRSRGILETCRSVSNAGDRLLVRSLIGAARKVVILRGRFHISVALLLLQRVWLYTSRQDEEPRLSRANRDSMAAGAALWEAGAVRAVEGDTSGRLFEVLRSDKSIARVDVDAIRQACSLPACKLLANPCKRELGEEWR